MKNISLRQIANVAILIATIAFNSISQIPSLNIGAGTNAEIANRYPDLYYFPANAAFSIWGIIYLFLTAFTIYQALPAQRENPHILPIGYLFVVTGILNIGWILCFQFEQFGFSMIMMLGLLATLITIYLRLGIGKIAVSLRDKWLVHVPFSIYLGWITAATVTNAAFVLRNLNWDGFGIAPEIWAAIMLIITGIIALAVIIRHHDLAYGLVIIWATYWIAARHSGVNLVATAALGVAGVVLVALIVTVIARRSDTPLTPIRTTA